MIKVRKENNMGKHIIIFGGCNQKKIVSKVLPILDSNTVERVYFLRRREFTFTHSKLLYITPPKILRKIMPLGEIYRIFFAIYILLTKKVDLIIGIHLVMHGYYAFILGKLFNKKYLLLFIENALTHKSTWFFQKIINGACMNGVRGSKAQKYFISLGVNKERIFNPPNEFTIPTYEMSPVKDRKYDVIYIGYLIKRKDLELWVEIIEKVKTTIPNVKAVIVGSGPYTYKINGLIESKELKNNIDMVGEQKDVLEYISQSRLHLLVSYSEGLPMATVECMALGLPVVLTNVGELEDLITNDFNGYLINSRDATEFSSAVVKILKDSITYEKFSINGKETISNMAKESTHQKLVALWTETLENV